MAALELPYTALITPAELGRDALASLSLDVSTTGDPPVPSAEADWNAVVQAIIDVTGLIERGLSRMLIVRAVVQGLGRCDFAPPYAGDAQGRMAAWARQWLVVEMVTTGYATSRDRTQILSSAGDEDEVEYFAGYRRADQDVTILNAATDPDDGSLTPLSAMTVLPPLVPGDIRGVCTELVLHRLFSAENEQFGTGRRMQQVGSRQMATVESVDREFVERTLARIHRHAYTVI